MLAVTAQGQGGAKSVTVAQTVTLTGLNDAPVLADTTLTATALSEDAADPSGSVGFRISLLATSSNITDSDTNAIFGLAIIATDSTHGVWYYSLNNGGTGYWIPFTATASTARLFTTHTNNRLYFKPDANWNGTVSSALTRSRLGRNYGQQWWHGGFEFREQYGRNHLLLDGHRHGQSDGDSGE